VQSQSENRRRSKRSNHTHLQTKHSINVLKSKHTADLGSDDEDKSGDGANNSINVSKPNVRKKGKLVGASASLMMKYTSKPNDCSLAATVAHLTACDGVTFRVFAASTDMRRLFAAAVFTDLPKSANNIKTLVSEHGQLVRSYVMTKLAERKTKGQKFSIIFDEWTSNRNPRYMIINVHEQGPMFWSLGLVGVSGSMPAERYIELLEKKLATFDLSLSEDIVATCTDGASVMCKAGRLIEAEQPLCYAHGIQLAVLDVLYKNKYNKRVDSDDVADAGDLDIDMHGQTCDGEGESDAEVDDSQKLDEDQTEGEEECEDPEAG
jgi:hypothetical protein